MLGCLMDLLCKEKAGINGRTYRRNRYTLNQHFFEGLYNDLILGMILSFNHAHAYNSLLDGRMFSASFLGSPHRAAEG